MARHGAWHLRSILQRSKSYLNVEGPAQLDGYVYDLSDHRASEIFSINNQDACNKIRRTVRTDGHEIEYELTENVTQRPETKTMSDHSYMIKNVDQSPLEVRIRLGVLSFSIGCISLGYLVLFVLINVVFAGIWTIQDSKCCGDPSMSFRDVFNFAIQTSTTLGYGGFEPDGFFSNVLVVIISFVSLTLNTLYAGILFLKFVTPSAKIEFSKVMTLCNVNGVPCIEIRVANADGSNMVLADVTARLSLFYTIDYDNGCGEMCTITNTQSLDLLSDWRHELVGVWTLRHVVDESSPLFGVLGVNPLNENIKWLRVSINATQAVSKTHVSASSGYTPEDILVGRKFDDQVDYDAEKRTVIMDYAKMNNTSPHLVWYPSKKGIQPKKLLRDEKLDEEV